MGVEAHGGFGVARIRCCCSCPSHFHCFNVTAGKLICFSFTCDRRQNTPSDRAQSPKNAGNFIILGRMLKAVLCFVKNNTFGNWSVSFVALALVPLLNTLASSDPAGSCSHKNEVQVEVCQLQRWICPALQDGRERIGARRMALNLPQFLCMSECDC